MTSVRIHADLEKELRTACGALGGHELERLLDGMKAGTLILDPRSIPIIRDYVRRIEDYFHAKYPGYGGEEGGGSIEEDFYLEDIDTYRNKLVYIVAGAIGDDFLEGYRDFP